MTCPCREALKDLDAGLTNSAAWAWAARIAREALAKPCGCALGAGHEDVSQALEPCSAPSALSEEGRGSDGTDEGTPSVRLHGTAVPPPAPSSESASGVWLMLERAVETLIWASGAFDTDEKSEAWAKNGRPVVNDALALLRERRAR